MIQEVAKNLIASWITEIFFNEKLWFLTSIIKNQETFDFYCNHLANLTFILKDGKVFWKKYDWSDDCYDKDLFGKNIKQIFGYTEDELKHSLKNEQSEISIKYCIHSHSYIGKYLTIRYLKAVLK